MSTTTATTAIPETATSTETAVDRTGEIKLTPEQLDAFGAELDAIRERVIADRGERRRRLHPARDQGRSGASRSAAGRCCWLGWFPPAWLAGTAALSLSKILDNMEIGHNVMHGQFDWTNDPKLSSKGFEWDTACPGDQWRHSHNYMHHTHTNIVGKDRDIGYGVLRMSEDQEWRPVLPGQPALRDAARDLLPVRGRAARRRDRARSPPARPRSKEKRDMLKGIWRKVRRQTLKDYVLFPALSGPGFLFTLAGNATANLVRNLWAFTIIFCGHFPDGTQEFSEEETEDETRGEWYFRQLLGSANLEGGRLFHILSGNLSHQIEHHLFPDLPANRYAEISVEVREICERYGIPYNSGPLRKQFGSVVRKICRLALPDRGGDDEARSKEPSLATS